MLLRVYGISFNGVLPKSGINSNFKTAFLQKDSFEKQKRFNPAFGNFSADIIPHAKIFETCENFMSKVRRAKSAETLAQQADEFFRQTLDKILQEVPQGTDEGAFFKAFRHELGNKNAAIAGYVSDTSSMRDLMSNIQDFNELACGKPAGLKRIPSKLIHCQKFLITKAVRTIKRCTGDWKNLETWAKNPEMSVSMTNFLDVLKNMVDGNVIFKRENILRGPVFNLDGPRVKNPFQLYNLMSQPILNAKKYGGKQFPIVEFAESGWGRKKTYYMSVTNPDTKPISDDDIKEILKGNGHRATNATESGIGGTGFGFSAIIKILKDNGYEADVEYLIEKGRKKGVRIRVPLIGVSNPLELF